MAAADQLIQSIVLQKIFPVLATVGAIWYFRDFIVYHTFKRGYAFVLNRITRNAMKKEKQKCFQSMHDMREQYNRDLVVLEIGAGAATNLKYLPYNTNLCCLDPNAHFSGYIKDNLKKNRTVVSMEIVCGVAENIPKPSDTFDVVLSSLVLCTVSDVEKSIAEVHRVLKPGGIFLYIEHVAAKQNSWTYSLQRGIAPLHRLIADGCDPSRRIDPFIKAAGFSSVETEHFRIKKFPLWLRYGILGKATK